MFPLPLELDALGYRRHVPFWDFEDGAPETASISNAEEGSSVGGLLPRPLPASGRGEEKKHTAYRIQERHPFDIQVRLYLRPGVGALRCPVTFSAVSRR